MNILFIIHILQTPLFCPSMQERELITDEHTMEGKKYVFGNYLFLQRN